MAVMNLATLVLCGVPVVGNVGTGLKRIGTQAAVERISTPLSLMPNPTKYPPAANPLDSRLFLGDQDDLAGWAGRSRGFGWVGASRSLASSTLGSVLSGRPQSAEQLGLSAASDGLTADRATVAAWAIRRRPRSFVLSTLCHAGHKHPSPWQGVEETKTQRARFEPVAGTFTASTRGES